MTPLTLCQINGAASEQIDDVEVLAQVQHDLDLGHHGHELRLGGWRLRHLHGHDRASLELVDTDGQALDDSPEGTGPDLLTQLEPIPRELDLVIVRQEVGLVLERLRGVDRRGVAVQEKRDVGGVQLVFGQLRAVQDNERMPWT